MKKSVYKIAVFSAALSAVISFSGCGVSGGDTAAEIPTVTSADSTAAEETSAVSSEIVTSSDAVTSDNSVTVSNTVTTSDPVTETESTSASEETQTETIPETVTTVTEIRTETQAAVISETELPQEQNYHELYAPVLDEIYGVIQNGYDFDREYKFVPTAIMERVMYEDKNELLNSIGYYIDDISGDGTAELIIGALPQGEEFNDRDIYSCYSYYGGKIIYCFESMARSKHKYLGNGYFGYIGSGGASNTFIGKKHIGTDGSEFIWDECYFTESDPEDTTKLKYFRSTNGDWDPANSKEAKMTNEEFNDIMDGYENDAVQLNFEPFISMSAGTEIKVIRSLGDFIMEGGLGDEGPITDLPDGEMEGRWIDPIYDCTLDLYEYRGEFDLTNGMGEVTSGEIIYNGDPDAPKYTLHAADGTDAGEIYFYISSEGYTCMSATLFVEEENFYMVFLKE